MKKILVIVASAFIMMACPSSEEIRLDPQYQVDRDNLVEQNVPGIFEQSVSAISYDEGEHQLYCNVTQLTSRIMDDEASEYIQVIFEKKPVVKKLVTATIYSTSGIGKQMNISTEFYVLDISNDLIYIWSDDNAMGAVMPWKM